MATARPAVGSAPWINFERTQADQFLSQELEEFQCSAQNELDWLNENMSDIFTKSKQKFADVFKTPSKLRGKTPRTIRKTDPRSARAPLTDLFAPKGLGAASPAKLLFAARLPSPPKPAARTSTRVSLRKSAAGETSRRQSTRASVRASTPHRDVISDASFVSAKEHDVQSEETAPAPEKQDAEMNDAPAQVEVYQSNDDDDDMHINDNNNKENDSADKDIIMENTIENKENNVDAEDLEAHSDISSPEPEPALNRKSSFTFSALPAREPLQKLKSMSVLPTVTPAANKVQDSRTPPPAEEPLSLKKTISTPVLPRPASPTNTVSSAHKNRLWSAIKSAKKIFASSASTSAAAKLEARSNDEELAPPPTVVKAAEPVVPAPAPAPEPVAPAASAAPVAPSTGKLKAPGRLVRPTKESTQSKPAPAIIRVASQSQRLGQGHSSQPSLSRSTTERPAPPSRDGSSRAPPPMAGRVKALEAAAKKKEADERAVARKAEQKLELERKRTEAKIQKEAEEERKRNDARINKEIEEERKRVQKEAEEERRRAHREAEEERKRAQKEAEETRARAAHDLAETIKRERAAQNQNPHPRSDVPGTLRQLTKSLKPAMKRPGPADAAPADVKRRRTIEEQDEPMSGMGQTRTSVMAPPKRPSMMRKEGMGKFNHGYSHAPPPAAHHASGMFKPANSNQMQHLQHKPTHPSHLAQMSMSSGRIPFAGASESSSQQHHYPGPAQAQQMQTARNPFVTSESQQQHYVPAQNQQMYKTPARPAANMLPKSSQAPKSAPKSAGTILGDNIELPEIMTDSEDEDDEEGGGGGFRVPSWAATPALRVQLEDQQLIDPETVFGPIGEMNMEEMFRNGKNTERLKQFRQRGSSALWVENRDQITSAEKRRDGELRARIVRDGGWSFDMSRESQTPQPGRRG